MNRNSNQRSKLNISVNRLDYLGIIISNNVLKFFVKSFHNSERCSNIFREMNPI